jgi:hypothetical protein
LNSSELAHNVLVVDGEATQTGQVDKSLFRLIALDEVSWGLVLQEGEDKDQTGKNDVKTGGDLLQGVSTRVGTLY